MASFFSVFVFFIYSMLMYHPEIEGGFLGNVPMSWLVFAEIILVLFSWFFIFYSMKAFLEARSKEFVVLFQLGMEKKQFSKLIFLETLIIGVISIVLGILFGYSFSKFFFMIVREILLLEQLPLYLSWKPFLLTITVYLSAFIIISLLSVHFAPEKMSLKFLKKTKLNPTLVNYSKKKAIMGIAFIIVGYTLALLTTRMTLILYSVLIPIFITIGTFYFFNDTVLYLTEKLKSKKKIYWTKSRMLSVAEQTFILKNNGKMFFVMTMVSTLAFLTIGLLATLSSYTSQYDKLNPLGLIYKGHIDNPLEEMHIKTLTSELEKEGLSYHLTQFTVMKQTSSYTNYEVEVFKQSDINSLLFSYGYPLVHLSKGEGLFIPYSEESIEKLAKKKVQTVLVENNVEININEVYPHLIFPSSIVGLNSIIISDEDFASLVNIYKGYPEAQPGYHLFTFDIPQWVEAKKIGLKLQQAVAEEYRKENYTLSYYFENAGLNYSYILSTYSLFTLVGLLVAVVFLLAAGSFIYFKSHMNMEEDKKKFDVLKRMGISDSELKRLVTKLLYPQFFLPWGIALAHSFFAFLVIQNILKNFVDVSIVKEVIFAFIFLILLQVIYFYLIRWRYLAHVKN